MPRAIFSPYPYQAEAREAALSFFMQNLLRFVLELPTGAGKTCIAADILRTLRGPRFRMSRPLLVIVPQLDLVQQTWAKFCVEYDFFSPYEVGLLQADHNMLGRPVTIASLDTLAIAGRMAMLRASLGNQPFGCIISDECHLETLGEAYKGILREVADEETLLIGLSATPYRGDNRTLATTFPDGVAYSIDWLDLVAAGYLSDIMGRDIPDTKLDLSRVSNLSEFLDTTGELPPEIAVQLESEYHYRQLYETWLHLARGKRTLIYTHSVKAAYGWKDFLEKQGYQGRVETITGKTKDRGKHYDRLRKGEYTFLTNCKVMRAGVDIREVECIIIDCPMGRLDFTQTIGRGLRLCPEIGKYILIVINGSDKSHQLMSVGKLIGVYSDMIPSVRKVAHDILEREEEGLGRIERKETYEQPDIILHLKEVRAKARDLFVSDGWRVHPTTGLLVKQGTQGIRVEAEPQLAGYLVSSVSKGGRRQTLSPRPVDARSAKRLGEMHLVRAAREAEKRAVPLGSHPDHKLPITEEQWKYLTQRQVRGVPKTLEDAQSAMQQVHYLKCEQWLDEKRAAFDRQTGRFIFFDSKRGDVVIRSSGKGRI